MAIFFLTKPLLMKQVTPRPGNIYAATKACQNMLGNIYYRAYGMQLIMVRAFNHIGPNQTSVFVASDFCKQVAEIEAGKKKPILHVGNLSAKRDFTDVRDVVRAYGLLIQHGKAGETYNIGSGHAIAIQELLDTILSLSTQILRSKLMLQDCVHQIFQLSRQIFIKFTPPPVGHQKFRWNKRYSKP